MSPLVLLGAIMSPAQRHRLVARSAADLVRNGQQKRRPALRAFGLLNPVITGTVSVFAMGSEALSGVATQGSPRPKKFFCPARRSLVIAMLYTEKNFSIMALNPQRQIRGPQ